MQSRALDAVIGAGTVATGWATVTVHALTAVGRPVARLVLHPPLVPADRHPARLVDELARRGAERRSRGAVELDELLDRLVPLVVEQVLARLAVTELVRSYVDLDSIVEQVDLDKAVARVDLDAAVARVDLDAAVARADLDAAVRRVDLDGAVALVDLDAVARRLDVDAVIDRVDLVGLAERVIAALDLAGIAEGVIDQIDLPEIIRESTGSVASQTVRGVRMQSMEADQALARVADRVLRRRRARATEISVELPEGPEAGPSSDEAAGLPQQSNRRSDRVPR